MAESEAPHVHAAEIEGNYFDAFLKRHGDFNPFAEAGWKTLRDKFQERCSPSTLKTKLLEIGCGTGRSRQIYQGVGTSHIGIDLSDTAVRIASVNFPGST